MPYRTFQDSGGRDWQVWDIVPRLSERRSEEAVERRVHDVEVPIERRREERRLAESRRSVLHGSFAKGWLCFESNADKRRLSPIPSDWMACTKSQLERYLNAGARVSGVHRVILGLDADTPLAEAG
jgi:hypothetical protein